MDTIQIGDCNDTEMIDQVTRSATQKSDGPNIVAFCCQNSGLEAAEMAAIGVEKKRICLATTAANMGSDFSRALMAMEAKLNAK